MRQIKFRAWDGTKMLLMHEICTSTGLEGGLCSFEMLMESISDMPLMQFTGLKDLQGKEIYEGDIVDYGNGRNKVVEFIDGCFCICGITAMPKLMTLYPVIGNIYENPELLK